MDAVLVPGHRVQGSSHYIAECSGVVKAGMLESAGVFGMWTEFVHNATCWAGDLGPQSSPKSISVTVGWLHTNGQPARKRRVVP